MSLKSIPEIQAKYLKCPLCFAESQFAVQVGVQYNLRDYPLTCKNCGHQAFIEFWKATTEELVLPTYYGFVGDAVVNHTVHTEADIQAGLEEQKIRDKLIELGWTPPQGPKDLDISNNKQAEPVAQPYAYVYEFDSGMFGIHRSFSSNERNGSKPSRVVTVYTHPAPAVAVNEQLLKTLKAAVAFINSHAADPDITGEMRHYYAELLACNPKEVIAAAEAAKGGV